MIANIVVVGGRQSLLGCQLPYRRAAAMRYTSSFVPLELEHREIQPSTALVTLNGKLLLGQDAAKLAALVPELIAAGHKNLVFDLQGVTHIDSTGIGRFIDAYSRLIKIGGKMRL